MSRDPKELRYAVISPVRNEAEHIEKTLESMASQTVPAAEWIIVNDSSTDETGAMAQRYADKHPWIKVVLKDKRADKGDRQRGKGVVDTFYFGRDQLSTDDYEFIIKLDGDVWFPPEYFEFLLTRFVERPRLGIAGGGLFERTDGKNWSLVSAPDHVGGPAKMYRRECFDAIGGIAAVLGWDGLDEWIALSKGWEVEAFIDLPVHHYRIMGNATGPLKAKIEQGYGAHNMGYHPLYQVMRGMRHLFVPPFLLGGCAMVGAYFWAALQGRDQLPDAELKRFIRDTQWRQLTAALRGKRVYKNGAVSGLAPKAPA